MVDNILLTSMLGAAIYNGIGYGTATDRKAEGYNLLKAGRTGVAGFLQAGLCALVISIVPDSVVDVVAMPETIWNGLMVGVAGAFGIDKGLKYVGVRNK